MAVWVRTNVHTCLTSARTISNEFANSNEQFTDKRILNVRQTISTLLKVYVAAVSAFAVGYFVTLKTFQLLRIDSYCYG
jgi:hypothetical protein